VGRGGCVVNGHPHPSTGVIVHPMFEATSTGLTRLDQEVVEIPLLLPRWQALELEATATEHGMTTGQMLRRVIRDLLAHQALAGQT
jgi:hypothetical protein